jgi:iron complex outermembrane recepter protein
MPSSVVHGSGPSNGARGPHAAGVVALTVAVGCLASGIAAADRSVVQPANVQVTATRLPAPLDPLPESVTVLAGPDLRARGASELRSALALVAGVDAPAGGDAGPSSAVPSFWGLHEFDAFLLVVDGVPWGGAFNPALATLDLNDVERIEVLKGAAPVMYGATSFVGVIHVIRYAAGSSADEVRVAARSRSGGAADLSTVLPAVGDLRQSLVLGADRSRLTGRDQGTDRGHVFYRGALPLGTGTATIDAEYTAQTQLPTSPVVRATTGLSRLAPLDANFNPADAGIVEHRARLTLGFASPFAAGEWHTRLAYTRSTVHDVRGFLRPELAVGADGNDADGFNQDRNIDDAWFDSFVALPVGRHFELTAGVDWLYGRGQQASHNFAYLAARCSRACGSIAPPSGSGRRTSTPRMPPMILRRTMRGVRRA